VRKAIQKIKKNNPDAAGVVLFSNLPILLDISPKSNTNSFEELPKVEKTGEADPTESELSDKCKLSEDETSESTLQVPTKSKLKVPTVEVVPPSPRKVIEDTGAQTVKVKQVNPRLLFLIFIELTVCSSSGERWSTSSLEENSSKVKCQENPGGEKTSCLQCCYKKESSDTNKGHLISSPQKRW
jgi:hypothetical protein